MPKTETKKTETKKTETKTVPERNYRRISIEFRGRSYPALADGRCLVGVFSQVPLADPRKWAEAVDKALAK